MSTSAKRISRHLWSDTGGDRKNTDGPRGAAASPIPGRGSVAIPLLLYCCRADRGSWGPIWRGPIAAPGRWPPVGRVRLAREGSRLAAGMAEVDYCRRSAEGPRPRRCRPANQPRTARSLASQACRNGCSRRQRNAVQAEEERGRQGRSLPELIKRARFPQSRATVTRPDG